jgi:hypothetical protein
MMDRRITKEVTVRLGQIESLQAYITFTFPTGSLLTKVRTINNQDDMSAVYIPKGYVRGHITCGPVEADLNVDMNDTEELKHDEGFLGE